jgi:hypothetical protein
MQLDDIPQFTGLTAHPHLIVFQFATTAIMKGGNGDIKRMQLYDKPAETEVAVAVVEAVTTPAEKNKKV